jgi:methionyl-tRNA formyltransferase
MDRVVFMGTPEFAVPVLEALAAQYDLVGVVTQPDRPAGRGRKLAASPVKEAALARGLPLLQPTTLHTPEAFQQLAAWHPAVVVVAAFGQLLHPQVLDLPPHGCLNIHGSLLPRYRGAAPIPAAILAGDEVTGVTIMHMDEGLDTGPILSQAEQPLAPGDTTGSLTAKLADLGAGLLLETLPRWLAGEIVPQVQDETRATYCRALTKDDGSLDWSRPAHHLDRQVRANDPWPGAYTWWQGQRLKLLRVRPRPGWRGDGQPGQVVETEAGIAVVTGEGLLELVEVQPAGKKPMPALAFALGQRDLVGNCLGAVA